MPTKQVLHVFPSFEVGGSQRRLQTYLNRSHTPLQHTVYAMDGCYTAGDDIRQFHQAAIKAQAVPKNNLWRAVKTCGKLLKEVKPDLLVTYNWGSIEWALANWRQNHCPMLHIQDGFGEEEQTAEKPARRLVRGLAYRRCTGVIVPSRQLAQIARDSWHIKAPKLHYIPNGVDLELFGASADKKSLKPFDINPDHLVIGTVAKLRPEKNIGRLIEAFSALENHFPEARLVVVGDGVGMSALKMLAERICLPERVIFTGSSSTPEAFVRAFDIFALSSDTEQMPISVLEAMAAGKPVVSTDVGDVSMMVSPENAALVEGTEAAPLAANLSKLIGDSNLRKKMGAANKLKAEQEYSLEAMITGYDRVFDLALS